MTLAMVFQSLSFRQTGQALSAPGWVLRIDRSPVSDPHKLNFSRAPLRRHGSYRRGTLSRKDLWPFPKALRPSAADAIDLEDRIAKLHRLQPFRNLTRLQLAPQA